MKQIKKNKWIDFIYKVNIINEKSIREAVKLLFTSILSQINNNSLIYLQFKVKEDPNRYRSISYIQSITNKDMDNMILFFTTLWNNKSEDYFSESWDYIILKYKITDSEKLSTTKLIESIKEREIKLKFPGLGYKLPLTTNFKEWGTYLGIFEKFHKVKNEKTNITFIIEVTKDNQLVTIFDNNNNKLYIFKDIFLNNNNNPLTFIRIINNNRKWYVENGIIKMFTYKPKFSYIKQIKQHLIFNSKILVMDLETRVVNEKMETFCVSVYENEKKINSFYLSDFENEKEMLLASFKDIMIRKYNGYRIYFHNFGKFDSIFVTSILTTLASKVKLIIKDGVILELKLDFYIEGTKPRKFSIFIRDSYLLLPASLSELTSNFDVENKSKYPIFMVNRVALNYEGEVPQYKDFTKITIEEFNDKFSGLSNKDIRTYKKFKYLFPNEYLSYIKNYSNNWNLRNETIKYCEQDVKSLYEVLIKFGNRIYDLYGINIIKYPTLPSLALAIFRSNFLREKDKLPVISGDTYEILKQSYTGGAVDVYKPGLIKDYNNLNINNLNQKVYRYDVNSLYPFVMKNYAMPVGRATYFEGSLSEDILKNKPFGFFEVEIEAPQDLMYPILQKKIKINNLLKTIAPLGNWIGWYFSEELYNAAEIAGYKFKILRGYLFKKGYIFKDYITSLYNKKKNSDKGSVDYLIAKLLMNSLYGRFGMHPIMEEHDIIKHDVDLEYWKSTKSDSSSNIITSDIINLSSGYDIISYLNLDTCDKYPKNISLPIASAVTAYARAYMSKFKIDFIKNNTTLYYSDTDSFDIDKPLNPKFVGNELGQLKLEHIFDEAIYLAPKVYGGINKDYELVKIKGYKDIINFSELKKLLVKDQKLEIPQEKWYRSLNKDTIYIKNDLYTLRITDNKRKLIYKDNKFINTEPYILCNGKIIN